MSSAIRSLSPRRPRHALLWRAVALLFALRALVPAGFMPDFDAARDGRVALAFCTAGTLKRVAPAGSESGKASHAVGGECAFALSATPALPAAAARIPAFAVAVLPGSSPADPAAAVAPPPRPPPARAPPFFS